MVSLEAFVETNRACFVIPPLKDAETSVSTALNSHFVSTPMRTVALGECKGRFLRTKGVSLLAGESVNMIPESLTPEGRSERVWHAVYTRPRHEMLVARQLDFRQIESYLPTMESVHVWKNRQRVRIAEPLFPSYLFVRVDRQEHSAVVQTPGVLSIVGNSRGSLVLEESTIDFLRSGFCRGRLEPWNEIAVGDRVRIKYGLMASVQGILVRKKSNLRFVISIEMINQNAAVEVNANDIEPVA
jgi:transcription antitermination factor NusG